MGGIKHAPARAAALMVAASMALALTLALALLASPARADALRVQFSTKVATGERPKVTLIADEAVDLVTVVLTDETGQATRARFGPLGRGERREVVLPALPGRHHFAGQLTVKQGGRSRDSSLSFDTVVAPQLRIGVDKARVDLTARRLEARFSRPAERAEIKVFAATGGALLAEATQDLGGAAAETPLIIAWPAPAGGAAANAGGKGDDVGRIDLRLYDPDGFHAGVSLYPWSVHIPHEEVGFATDAATIAASEQPKLEASLGLISAALARHRDLGPIRLYIAGHTDTVGKPAYNLGLSQRRAQAIAAWFRRRGLRLPILYEAFGEHAPLVGTADETDEARNRRVDYILAIDDPLMKASAFRPTWKRIP
jgi:outer membrane protein OmpA-like peptidoglycan-associated protein